MIFALFANLHKKEAFEIAKEIRTILTLDKIFLVTRDEDAASLDISPLSSVDSKQISCLISLGGDGTILRLVHTYPNIDAPILGINIGHLGFLADIPKHDLKQSLLDLVKGAYTIENRVMMEGITPSSDHCFAVNDMVIHRASNPSLIDLSIHVDGDYLNTFSADGVIISTPSGSTAYSLAAGGPILTPELEAFVITPISPHTISNRPIVLMPKQKIEIQYLSAYDPVEITFDGIARYTMKTDEVFSISRSIRHFNMIKLHRSDYFNTLRNKLLWSGQVRQVTL